MRYRVFAALSTVPQTLAVADELLGLLARVTLPILTHLPHAPQSCWRQHWLRLSTCAFVWKPRAFPSRRALRLRTLTHGGCPAERSPSRESFWGFQRSAPTVSSSSNETPQSFAH